MKTKDNGKLLIKKLEDFTKEIEGLNFEFKESKQAFFYKLNLKLIALEFVYTKKERIMVPASLLYCRVYLQKNSDIFYHFPELMKYIGPKDYRAWYFPYIENEMRMDKCLEVLTDMIKEYLPRIIELVSDNDKLNFVEKEIEVARINRYENGKEIKYETEEERQKYLQWIQTFQEKYEILPQYTCFSGYELYIAGEYDNALEKYEKLIRKGNPMEYELRLYEYIKGLKEKCETFEVMPEECNAAKIAKYHKGNLKDFKWFMTIMITGTLFFAVVYAVVIIIANALMSIGAEYVAGMRWYHAFLLSGLPGLFGGLAYRIEIGSILNKKNYEEMKSFDEIMNSETENKFVKIVFNIVSMLMTIFVIVIIQMSSIFYGDHFLYDDGEKILAKNVRYEYSDIETIYFVEGRYNDWDEWIGRSSYILKFENGTIIDLDGITSVKETEEHILPLLENYVSEVVYIKSEKDIK